MTVNYGGRTKRLKNNSRHIRIIPPSKVKKKCYDIQTHKAKSKIVFEFAYIFREILKFRVPQGFIHFVFPKFFNQQSISLQRILPLKRSINPL